MKDSENPYLLPGMESAHIKDIACSYKYCSALNDKGEIFVWGNYINDKIKNQKKRKMMTIKEERTIQYRSFP